MLFIYYASWACDVTSFFPFYIYLIKVTVPHNSKSGKSEQWTLQIGVLYHDNLTPNLNIIKASYRFDLHIYLFLFQFGKVE